jgi:hypothetical protein
MTSPAVLREHLSVGKLYGRWQKLIKERPRGMADTDALAAADAYLLALDAHKHGDEVVGASA